MNQFIPNSFQVPNALVDEVIASIKPNALKCYLVIVRKTVGWQKEWDAIPTTQLMELTGIKKKTTVYAAIAELEELELIECVKATGKTTEYRLKVVPNKVVTKKGTSDEKENEVVPQKGTGTSTENGYTSKDTNKNNNQNIKNTKKDFTFNLSKLTQYENLTQEYKDSLEIYALLKDCAYKLSDFLNHHISKGSKFKDWSRAYSTWISNSKKFEKYEPNKPELTEILVNASGGQRLVKAYDCGSVLVTEDGVKLKKKQPQVTEHQNDNEDDIDVMSILAERKTA